MKTFRQFLREHAQRIPTKDEQFPTTPQTAHLQRIMGELRMAGIHAGDRDSQQPYVATRSMMALSGAAQRIQNVLVPHGLFLGTPQVVVRESAETVRAQFHVYGTADETKRLGELTLMGELNPVDRGTLQFRASLEFAPDFLF